MEQLICVTSKTEKLLHQISSRKMKVKFYSKSSKFQSYILDAIDDDDEDDDQTKTGSKDKRSEDDRQDEDEE
jgi:hypothetical protein